MFNLLSVGSKGHILIKDNSEICVVVLEDRAIPSKVIISSDWLSEVYNSTQ